MNGRSTFTRVALCALSLCAHALAATELAPGLTYLRPTAQEDSIRLPVDTAAAVIDLRQVAPADADAANALLTTIKASGPAANRLILALVEPETSPALRTRLTHLPRCLTIGRSAPDFKTDIVVTTSAEADQLALTALASGTPPEKLLNEHIEKIRYDESALLLEHQRAPVMTVKKAPDSPLGDNPSPLASPEATDAVLLRAVHIYLGLVALKKL